MAPQIALRRERIKELREARGWSQRELARRCGFGESQIRKYENGESDPSATYLNLMADQFQVSTDYLLGRSDDIEGKNIKISIELSGEEKEVVLVFREKGWPGIMQLMATRMAK